MDWISVKDRPPPKEGQYFVYFPSADPKLPFYFSSWWNPHRQDWELIPSVFRNSPTHWMKPQPPKGDSDGR